MTIDDSISKILMIFISILLFIVLILPYIILFLFIIGLILFFIGLIANDNHCLITVFIIPVIFLRLHN